MIYLNKERELILELLTKANLSTQEIFNQMKRLKPDPNINTVRNILWRMHRAGLIEYAYSDRNNISVYGITSKGINLLNKGGNYDFD